MGKSSHVAYSVITYINHYFGHRSITIMLREFVFKTCICIKSQINIVCCVTSSKGFEITINKFPKSLLILHG